MTRRAPLLLACLAVTLGGLGACSTGEPAPAQGEAAAPTSTAGRLRVVTAVYPLAYAAERIGGDTVEVVNLTPPGAEPHDVELTPQDVVAISEADLVIYESGLQPALDEAITGQQVANAFDVAESADLQPAQVQVIGPDEQAGDDHGGSGDDHGGAGGSTLDPHFWLDPLRYEKVSAAMAAELGRISQTDRMTFDDNVDEFSRQLTTLDGDFAAGLQQCEKKDIVTSHAAFGYLAQRYGLRQVAVSGLTGGGEADPARMAQITDYVRKHSVRTIYIEPLVDPALGRTVAQETGVSTAVLDPIESLTDSSPGRDYLEIMRANLATLQKGQNCS